MNLEHELVRAINRRHFFGRTGAGLGLGAIALDLMGLPVNLYSRIGLMLLMMFPNCVTRIP